MELIREAVISTTDYLFGPSGNESAYYDELFENAGAKAGVNFTVTVVDIFG